MRRTVAILLVPLTLLLAGIPAAGREKPSVVKLPDARVGVPYSQSVHAALRDVGFKVDSRTTRPAYAWSLASGELPAGLQLVPTGQIVGTPTSGRADAYEFKLRVEDRAAPGVEPLELSFSLSTANPKIELVEIDAAADDASATGPADQAPARTAALTTSASRSGSIVTPTEAPVNGAVFGTVHDVYGEPVPRVELLLKKDANVIARARSADDGHFYFSVPPDVYTLATSAQHFEELTKKVTVTGGSEEMLDLDLHDTDPLFGGEFVRTIIGLEQSGASSSDREFHYFSDAYFDAPLVGRKHADPYFGPRLRVWGDARITSVPQTLDATVSDFATNEALATNIGALKANEVAQAVEVLAGVEYRLLGSSDRLFPSFARDTKNRFTVSLIAGGGLVTPVSATEGASVYTLDARSRTTLAARGYDVPADATYFAFVPKERDRFFRQFYAGLRLKTFYADSDGYPTRRAPAMFDVSIGGHEAFTGGRFRNAVLRLDGFYPLPYEKARWLYIFGTAILGPKRTVITDPLVAVRAPDGVKVTDSAVHVIPVDAINKDYYRIGFAVDAIDLIRTIKKSTDK